MLLLTKEIKERLVKNHNENEQLRKEMKEPKRNKAVVKLFNPVGRGFWFLTELDPATNIAWGGAKITDWDLGTISMTEIENVKGPLGLGIERDKYFESNKYTLEECAELVKDR